MAEYWCFNCEQLVDKDEVYRPPRHKNFLGKQLAAIQFGRRVDKEISVCICQDCVFYRIQVCSCCKKAAPLCMYTLEEWFIEKSTERKCLDCTALNETLHFSSALPYRVPTRQFVQQCFKCSKFKYICSFIIFQHCYNEQCCHRAIRDGNERSDNEKSTSICIECKLRLDIQEYKIFLKERYHLRVSLEPSVSAVDTTSIDSSLKSYANAVRGIDESNTGSYADLVGSKSPKQCNGPVFIISSLKGSTVNIWYSLTFISDGICIPRNYSSPGWL